MRVMDIKIEDINFSNFTWRKSQKTIHMESPIWNCFYKDTKRGLGTLYFDNRKDMYIAKVTVFKLSGDFRFEEEDLEVTKFKVIVKLVEYLKDMHNHSKRKYFEIY